MCVLSLLKLQNIESFATMFLNYDLLAQRWLPYSYIYPFAEGFAGVLMISGALRGMSVPVTLFVGSIGAFPSLMRFTSRNADSSAHIVQEAFSCRLAEHQSLRCSATFPALAAHHHAQQVPGSRALRAGSTPSFVGASTRARRDIGGWSH